jgi:phosphate transport system substrate-binding protein
MQFSEDDNVLVQGVEGSPYALGYFGFAYYTEEAARLKALAIDAGDGAVEPNFDSVEGGSYYLARPLFIYSDAGVMTEKSQVADFINFYLTNVNDVIGDVGYFPASVEALNEAKQAWLTAVGQ